MEEKRRMFPLNLQLFNGGEGDDGAGDGEQSTNEGTSGDNGQGEAGTGDDGQGSAAEKTFTQAEVDAIVKDRLKRAKIAAKQPQKNEDNAEELANLRAEVDALKQDGIRAKGERYALKQGVSEDKLDKVMKLAALDEEEDITKAIDNVLKEFDVFKVNNKAKVTTGNASGNAGKESEPQSLQDALTDMYNTKNRKD